MRWQSVLAGSTAAVSVWLMQANFAEMAEARQDLPMQFAQPPVLVEQPTLELNRNRRTYTFSIRVPDNAGAAMAGVLLESNGELLDFDLSETEAFRLTRRAAEIDELDLRSVEPIAPNQIQIRFAEPVNPGTTITIALEPRHIPRGSNAYQIGVSAFPVAAETAIFLGYQQINTCRSRDDQDGDRRVLFWDLPPEFDPRVRNNPCRR